MTLKRKIALNISIAFSLIFGIVMLIIYYSFYDFRKDQFQARFKQRLLYTINVIQNSNDFENHASLFFDENSDDVLLNEKILIFNRDKKLIYSTVKDQNVKWDQAILNRLDKKNTISIEDRTPEVYAALRKINGSNYYIITFARDTNGISKLDFLKYVLLISYIISVILIWLTSYYLVSKFLKPLDRFKAKISEITAHKLTTSIPIKNEEDEIGILAKSFNTMIARLDDVFQSQKDFTSSAAHEIRTPITRIAFQLENLIQLEQQSDKTKATLQHLLQDVHQLSDLTKSLLLLSKIDKEGIADVFEDVRIDEVIFEAFEAINRNYPDFKIDFQIDEKTSDHAMLLVKGVKSLLEIVFINLFKNAAIYSNSKFAVVLLKETDFRIIIDVVSDGQIIAESEREKMFEAFNRASNSHQIVGHGLGLRIAKRILSYHKSEINYFVSDKGENDFRIIFSK